jgi:cytochrome c-type biogenesis protein CcmF
MRWRHDNLAVVVRRLMLPAVLAVLAFIALAVLAPGIGVLPRLGLIIAAGVAAGSIAPLWKRNLRRTPLFTYGMIIAHLGVAVSLAGMASESAFIKETLIAAEPGETHSVGPYAVRFDRVEPIAGPNWTAVEATLTATRGDRAPHTLRTQARTYWAPVTETNEAAIKTVADGQLYVVLGNPGDDGRWQLRLWWKPFVTLIWFGGGMIAFGGLLALVGRVWRERRSRIHREAYA